MGIKTKDFKISNGKVFKLTNLKFDPAMENLGIMLSILSPTVSTVISSLGDKMDGIDEESLEKLMDTDLSEVGFDKFAPTVAEFLKIFSEPSLKPFMNDMLGGMKTQDDNGVWEDVDIQEYFSGNLGEARELLITSCKYNFSSFLEGLGISDLLALVPNAAPTANS